MKYFYEYNNKFCNLFIAEESENISLVSFNNSKLSKEFIKKKTPLINNTINQLEEYFAKKRKTFDIPLFLNGTDFYKKVWEVLKTIPYGEYRSYGQIAAMINKPKASRAVGLANNRNPIVIIIPCHRVIGHNGSLVGYAGGLELKKQLLDIEKHA
ncbi:MAG: methylated-DNA--[protein]-cysteine S-methyltransferase [Treponema sp.]|nr:methylated-DNA--[protein]-cysteine S-methyltransferase [Treponema sp.]